MVTLKDIAEEANVSLMTVSNVINGNLKKVSKEKAELIQAIIRERHYVQNATARSLAKAHSSIIAIMLRDLKRENSLSSPHNATLIGEIIHRVQELGYFAMINLVESQDDIARNLLSWNARGAIFLGMLDNEIEQIYSLSSIPMVFIDSYSNVRQLSSVGIDDYKGGRLAAEHLIAYGHRGIAFISPPDYENSVIAHRLQGFTDELAAHGLSLPATHRLTLTSDVDPSCVNQSIHRLLELRGQITAVFATSDQMAASLIGGLSANGIRTPDDISVVGFDDMPISMQISPRLTTIAQDLKQKASLTVEILQRQLQNKTAPAESRVLDVRLISRSSVAQRNS